MNIFIGSFLGGIVAEVVTQPICITKTIYQSDKISITESFNKIYQNGGWKMFFRASWPALISQGLSSSSKYTLYRFYDKSGLISEIQIEPLRKSILGALAGCTGSLITNPFDVYKIGKQKNPNYHLADYFSSIKDHGINAIYKGYFTSIWKNIAIYSILLPMNDYMRTKTKNISNHISFNNAIAGLITTPLSTLVVSPIDYIRTRLIATNGKVSDIIHDMKTVPNPIKNVIYRGYTLNLLRSAPHFSIVMLFTSLFE